jgi:NodT family efflux transporter outer membrane factor (OMF) lipoprotein
LSPAQFPQQDWWRQFGDAELDRLIATALTASPDLHSALDRVRAAQAAANEADSARLPRIDLAASVTRERLSENDIYPPPLGGAIVNRAQTLATAQWTPDFFGGERARLDAAIGQARAAEADAQAARVLLASDVAQGYFNLARLQAQQRLDATLLDQREHTLRLVQQRVGAGLDTTLAERQAQAEAPQIRVHAAQLDAQIAAQRHALAALLGTVPAATGTLNAQLPPRALPALPTQLPAELLGHRADVVAARWRVESATRDVAAIKTTFYPDINLAAFVGFEAIGLSHWLTAGSNEYGVKPAISLPLFDAGRLRAQLAQHTAQLDLAIDSYNARVLAALREVADQLSSWRALQTGLQQQQTVQHALDAAAALAQTRYQAGLDNYLAVLVAQAAALQQQRNLIDLQAQTCSAEVALIRALGGGYADEQSPSSNLSAGVRHE